MGYEITLDDRAAIRCAAAVLARLHDPGLFSANDLPTPADIADAYDRLSKTEFSVMQDYPLGPDYIDAEDIAQENRDGREARRRAFEIGPDESQTNADLLRVLVSHYERYAILNRTFLSGDPAELNAYQKQELDRQYNTQFEIAALLRDAADKIRNLN